MSKTESRRADGTARAADFQIAGRDDEIHNTPVTHVQSPATAPPPPPDLQALVKAYGDYASIPPDAWQRFDAAMASWKESIRNGDSWHSKGGATWT